MVGVEQFWDLALGHTLVMFRVGGLFLLSPMISGRSIPIRVRVMLVIIFSAGIMVALPPRSLDLPHLTLGGVAALAVGETLVGFVIGFLAMAPIVAMQLAGHMMGYQMGLGLAQSYNPELDTSAGVMSMLTFLVGTALFVAIGGVEALFVALLTSFDTMPPGGVSLGGIPAHAATDVLHVGFELALRIAAPVIVVMLLENVSTGIIMKTLPQVNIMSFGFAAKNLIGLLMLVLSLWAINSAFSAEVYESFQKVMAWVEAPDGQGS